MILFVSHDAHRTGAPMVFLHLLRWLKNNTDLEFEILLKSGGELAPEFEAIAPVHIIQETIPQKISRKLKLCKNFSSNLPFAVRSKKYDLIYSNTITNGELVACLKKNATKVITHVHEMDSWIEKSGEDNWNEVVNQTTRFIAVSEPVRECLIRRGVKKDSIKLLPECASAPSLPALTDRKSIREALGISDGAFVIGGGGAEMWRKGRDLFVQLAASIIRAKRSRDFHFIWLGSHIDEEATMWLKHDSQITGCANFVHWVGSVKNPEAYFSAMDAFAMISREDPMPLVALEAGMMGLPVVCFDHAGGTADWVKDKGGYTVPYLDVTAMAEKILLLSNDQGLLRVKGKYARTITKSHYNVDTVGKNFAEYLFQELET